MAPRPRTTRRSLLAGGSTSPVASTSHSIPQATGAVIVPHRRPHASRKKNAIRDEGIVPTPAISAPTKGRSTGRQRPASRTIPRTKETTDYLSPLSSELLSLILHHLSPASSPSLPSLFNLSLVNKSLLPHVKAHLYRSLKIETRTDAHAMHRTLHGSDVCKGVKKIEADVGAMSKTSSQWVGWFLFHSMHSLCGIIGSCRTLLELTLYLPTDASAWTQSLCSSLVDLKLLHTLNKDVERISSAAGRREGMDIGWRAKKDSAMWSLSQFIKPLASLKSLKTLRICGISSDSSTSPPSVPHNCHLTEVVLLEVNITNSDLLHLLGTAQYLKKLTLWRSSLLSKRGLTHVLKKCTNLVEIRIGASWFGAKDEEDTNFPLDNVISFLPSLRLIHVSGSLISPSILLQPSTNLTHLLVVSCSAFTPSAIHTALAKMRSDPSPVKKLSLPEMGRDGEVPATVVAGGGVGAPAAEWNEKWRFTVRAICEAKGVLLEEGRTEGEDEEGSDGD